MKHVKPISFVASCMAASLLFLPVSAFGQAFETQARAAYVYDHSSGQVLLAHNADESLPPASMSKLMTLFMTFEALRDGRLTLDTRLPVSANAMSFGGSTMFLNTRDRPTVEELIRGVVIVSGNDASVALAEALSPDGTEAGFAQMMTNRAQELGMTNSRFANASGWPDPGHRMSMEDLGILARHLIEDFPEYYGYFAEREFDYEDRSPANRFNRNPLLGLGIGADGLKTGHTSEAGYGLVGSALQGDRRVTFAIGGLDTTEARARESERIVTWAFRQFSMTEVLEQGVEIASAPVFMGSEQQVSLAAAESLELLLPVVGDASLEASISYESPLPAPIEAGDIVGEIQIRQASTDTETTVPLMAVNSVSRGGPLVRVSAAWQDVVTRLSGSD